MFTVLIAEKGYIDAIQQENKLFFEPFLENKEISFCYWNPDGQSLYDSVPGLMDAVGRRKEWRAVIINSCEDQFLHSQNPYDTVDFKKVLELKEPDREYKESDSWKEWSGRWAEYYEALVKEKEVVYRSALEKPLQKLATWLCFRPEDYILNDVREKQDATDWAMENINKDMLKPSAHLEALAHNQYKQEMRLREEIRRDFIGDHYLNIAYPAEVHCISPRTAENGFFNPETYWSVRLESEYSAFAERNMYFDKMRFMVFDILAKTHRDFRNDLIRFLATILIFVANPVPGSALQSRHVYKLETETDDTPLCKLVTSYDKKLAVTSEEIDAEMEKIRSEIPEELSDRTAEALFCTAKDVDVVLDENCDFDAIYGEEDYGLFYDSPFYENSKWMGDYKNSQKELAYITKQQMRAVRKTIDKLERVSEVPGTDISRLTSFQIDDVRDYTNNAENEMVESTPPDISDMSQYAESMKEAAEDVEKVLKQRMTQKTTMVLGGLCLGLYIICFLPFLFANNGTIRTVSTAVLMITLMVVFLLVAMFVALFKMRKVLVQAVQNYNDTVRMVADEIRGSMEKFSKYLSALCNVRRGYKIQNYANTNVDEYTKSLRIRRKHQEDIRKKRAYLAEEYKDYFGDSSFYDEAMIRPYDYNFDVKSEYPYPAPFLAGDFRQIEFISNGNFVEVPSSYVKHILVRMEEIYDK